MFSIRRHTDYIKELKMRVKHFKFMVLFVLLYIPIGTLCILGASYMFTTVGEMSGYCNIPITIINFMFVNWLLGA